MCMQVRKLFKGAVEVGNRFPIVHVPMDDTIHEVSSFLTDATAHRHLPGSACHLGGTVRSAQCWALQQIRPYPCTSAHTDLCRQSRSWCTTTIKHLKFMPQGPAHSPLPNAKSRTCMP